jgi:PAS domain S-box-containing protein
MDKKFIYNFELFDSFPDMYFCLSENGEIQKMNSVAENTLQGTKDAEHYSEIFDLIELCDRNEAQKLLKETLEEKKVGQYKTKFYINRKLIDVNLTFIIPFPTINENSPAVIAAARDITEETQKEDDLLRFHNIAEGSVNPVLITDISGKMIYVNPAFTKITGYSKEELLGRNPRIFGSGKYGRKFWDKVWAEISSGKVWFGEVEDKKTGYFGIHRDLSEKRTLEKQLIHTQKMESIGTLAAGIAHEVGNPLASISALVQVVRRDSEDTFIREKLGLVKSQVTRISKIIRDLVDFSRPSNYELQITDINRSIEEAVAITRVGTKVKDIDFNLELSDDVPSLPLIPDQIHQVFLNILINAVDALTETKKRGIPKKVDVKSAVENELVVLTFSDTGSGINEENLTKVFEPFFTTKEQGKGTGLGLWISYGIVKSFQGDLKVESTQKKGTTFTLTLPLET